MPDGNAPEAGEYNRTTAQENEWHALLVPRQTLLDAGVNLDQRIPILVGVKGGLDRDQGSDARRERTREAREAAEVTRKETEEAAEWERWIYSQKPDFYDRVLDRPPREKDRRGVVTCKDPAPSYGRHHKPEMPGQKDNGVRYPLLSEATSNAAHFLSFNFCQLCADAAEEISSVAAWLGSEDGFRRVDPTWERVHRELNRKRYRDHLERDADGRATVRPMPLEVLLRDFPPNQHELVRFVHEIVSQYCEPVEPEPGPSKWALKIPRERRPTAYEIYRTCTPKRRGGGPRKTIPSLVDAILQRGFRESIPLYRSEGPASDLAARIAARWTERVTLPQSVGHVPARATQPTFDPWSRGYSDAAPSHHCDALALNLHTETCPITDGSCPKCALRK